MNAPLMIAERLEARALAANAVRSAFYDRFGENPSAYERLGRIDPAARLGLVGDVELKLGVAFRNEDIEFLETPADRVPIRGVADGGGRRAFPAWAGMISWPRLAG